jgi:hypothetical protein
MISPTININGSSAEDLIQPRRAAYDALQAASEALQQVTPNGRDYPGDIDKCMADRDAHFNRLRALKAIMADIMAEAINIKNQKEH